MNISSISSLPLHDALPVNHKSTTLKASLPNNVTSNELNTIANNQDPQPDTTAVTAPIDDGVKEVKEKHGKHKHKHVHANKHSMKVLKKGAKMMIKTIKNELKDLIKTLGFSDEIKKAARHELKDFAKELRSDIKSARHHSKDINAAAMGRAFQAEFDSFYSKLGKLLSHAASNPGDDNHSVDHDPSDSNSIDATQVDLAPDGQTAAKVTSSSPTLADISAQDVSLGDGKTPSDPLDSIVSAFQKALASLMDNLKSSARNPHHHGHGHGKDSQKGLIVDIHG